MDDNNSKRTGRVHMLSVAPVESETLLTDVSSDNNDSETDDIHVQQQDQASAEFSRNFEQLSKINDKLLDQLQHALPLMKQLKTQSRKFANYMRSGKKEISFVRADNPKSSSQNDVSVEARLVEAEKTLNMISRMNKTNIDSLIDQLQLPLLKHFKATLQRQQFSQNENKSEVKQAEDANVKIQAIEKISENDANTNSRSMELDTGDFGAPAILPIEPSKSTITSQSPQQLQQQQQRSSLTNIDMSSITNSIVESLTDTIQQTLAMQLPAFTLPITNPLNDGFGAAQVHDDMSLFSGVTGVTGVTSVTDVTAVSSIAPLYLMDDPLVIMLGIGEFDGMDNLDGIAKDYDNIINTFSKYWKYKIFYQLNDNTNVYSNDIDDELRNKTNYKLKWDINEIELFVEKVRKCIIDNKHNGFLFAISSHGDTGKVIYDSNCESYELSAIFSMFSPEKSSLLESHSETEEESQHLFQIPKLFFLDHCRGNAQARVTNVGLQKNDQKETSAITTDSKTTPKKGSINIPKKATTTTTTTTKFNPKVTSQSLTTLDEKGEEAVESFSLKTVSKEEARTLVSQMANFCKVYANIEGFVVGDGSKNGGLFLRNVCKCFKDTKFIRNHQWDEIIIKIREYTKREATIFGSGLVNMTQLVENEGTLERPIAFGSKYVKFEPLINVLESTNDSELIPLGSEMVLTNINENSEIESNQMIIANVSKTNKIAVLVEYSSNKEDRDFLLRSLSKTKVNLIDSFNKNRYVIIDESGQSKNFDKIWEMAYISLFELSNDAISDNKLILDRSAITSMSDHLYYVDGKLCDKNELIPKCKRILNETHLVNLGTIATDENDVKCIMCEKKLGSGKNSYTCSKCKYYLCNNCCDLIICKQLPFGLNMPVTISNIEQLTLKTLQLTCNVSPNNINIIDNKKYILEIKSIITSEEETTTKHTQMQRFGIDVKNEQQVLSINLDTDLNDEFKQELVTFNAQVRLAHKDTKESSVKSLFSTSLSKSIQIDGFYYKCTFTTLNGIGRYGPTEINDEYKGRSNEKDTRLDDKQQGMQLWTVPHTGKWKVVCYGAAGGDSIWKAENEHLHGGLGAKVGGIIQLHKNDTIKILVGQAGATNDRRGNGGGGGGTYFVLYKVGDRNQLELNSIVNIPLIIASGGHGANNCKYNQVNGVSGLGRQSDSRKNYGGYTTYGCGGRGASFENDFDKFQSYIDTNRNENYNKCNPVSFMDGGIGGNWYETNVMGEGGFGGGGGGGHCGGAGGGYIGGLVSPQDNENINANKYALYGALSFNACVDNDLKINLSGKNIGNGKIEVQFLKEK